MVLVLIPTGKNVSLTFGSQHWTTPTHKNNHMKTQMATKTMPVNQVDVIWFLSIFICKLRSKWSELSCRVITYFPQRIGSTSVQTRLVYLCIYLLLYRIHERSMNYDSTHLSRGHNTTLNSQEKTVTCSMTVQKKTKHWKHFDFVPGKSHLGNIHLEFHQLSPTVMGS